MIKNIIAITVGVLTLSFIGIKYEPEFIEPSLFVKHKPNLKVTYYSPIAESDRKISELTGAALREEKAYREFVGDFFKHKFLDDFAPLFVIFGVTLISWGAVRLYLKAKVISYRYFITELFCSLVSFILGFGIYYNVHINGKLIIVGYTVTVLLITLVLERRGKLQYRIEPKEIS